MMMVVSGLMQEVKRIIICSIIDLYFKVTAATWQGQYYLHVSIQQPSYEPPLIPEYNKQLTVIP